MTDAKPYIDGNTLWMPHDLAALLEVIDRLDTVPPPPPGYTLYPGDDPAVALADLAAGDTLWLSDGTHPYEIHLPKAVNVRAVDGASPVVSGWRSMDWIMYSNPFGEPPVYRVRLNRRDYGLSHQIVDNVHFRNAQDGPARMAAHNFATQPELVTYDGEPLRRVPLSKILVLPREPLTQAYDEKDGWLYIILPVDHDLDLVQVAALPQLLTAADGVAGITVDGLTFTGAANTHKQGAVELHSDGNTLRNLRVEMVNSLGYSLRGIGLTMVGVKANDCGQMGHWMKVQGSTIKTCGHAGSNWRGSDAGWHASNKWEQCIGNTVDEWYAIGPDGCGLWLDVGNHDNAFTNIDLHDCGKNALMLEHYATGNTFGGSISDTRPLGRWAGSDIQIQSNVKGNAFDGLEIVGDLVPHWLVYKTQEGRGPSGPNTFRNITTGGRPAKFEPAAHEKDTFQNVV